LLVLISTHLTPLIIWGGIKPPQITF